MVVRIVWRSLVEPGFLSMVETNFLQRSFSNLMIYYQDERDSRWYKSEWLMVMVVSFRGTDFDRQTVAYRGINILSHATNSQCDLGEAS